MATNNFAPDEIPSTYGPAIGLPKKIWSKYPDTESAPPRINAAIILGSLIDMIRDAVRSSTAGLTDKVASYCAVVVDAFTLSINMLANTMDMFVDAISDVAIDTSPIKGMAVTMKNVGRDIKDGYRGTTTTRLQDEDIYKIANAFYEVIKEVPIENKVVFDVKEGDVNIDGERVGRRLEPIISRIQATS